MKSKLFAFLTLLIVAAVGLLMDRSKAQLKPAKQQISELEEKKRTVGLTLKQHVDLAKLRGEQKITVSRSYKTSLFPSFKDLDTAAAIYTVVLARPVASLSRLNEDGRIVTSYKFKTIEQLSEPAGSKFTPTFHGTLPEEFQPFDDGEFMVTTRGGTVNIDGVEVTEKYDVFEQFSQSSKYLLFLTFDTTKKVGGMSMGPLSALVVNDDGTMSTLDKQKSHEIKQSMDVNFGDSFEQVKSHLKYKNKIKS